MPWVMDLPIQNLILLQRALPAYLPTCLTLELDYSVYHTPCSTFACMHTAVDELHVRIPLQLLVAPILC